MLTELKINPRPPFSFEQTIYSHGWVNLLPNSWDMESRAFSRVEQLQSGKVVLLTITGNTSVQKPEVFINVRSEKQLLEKDSKQIIHMVNHMLRIDEDLSGFYELCQKHGGRWLKALTGAGRLLRSPTLFEDVIKTICTTNIQWGGTKRMVNELVETFGASFPGNPERKAFPTAKSIAALGFEEFDRMVRLGYRSRYVHECAAASADGSLDLDGLQKSNLETSDLKKELLKIKGIGNYAAATLLMLLGHYDELPIDSVFKEFVSKKYFPGKKYSEKKALSIYRRWGNWKHLAYWFDLWQGLNEDI
ncbi:MAG: DNA-3-methyladenine glycosylase 2 family protein [Calditrichaeota bacterium]|nr:DNA-3-methyladenine glycosylase 2 family protein [Calditrichota bacterium]